MQVDVIKGKQGENRLVITLNGKVCYTQLVVLYICLALLCRHFQACQCLRKLVLPLAHRDLTMCHADTNSLCCFCCSFCRMWSKSLTITLLSPQSELCMPCKLKVRQHVFTRKRPMSISLNTHCVFSMLATCHCLGAAVCMCVILYTSQTLHSSSLCMYMF